RAVTRPDRCTSFCSLSSRAAGTLVPVDGGRQRTDAAWEGGSGRSMEPPHRVRRARGLRRMDAILDAAEVCFARRGYAAATTNHIAAQAGISPGSLYQFFANKDAIAQALATRYNAELEHVYAAAFAGEAAAAPLARWLDQVLATLLTFHDAHPAF